MNGTPITLSLPDELLDSLAERLAELVAVRLSRRDESPNAWLDSTAAADYLGVSRDSLHKLTSARQLAFSQTVRGAPCFFRTSDLDTYRAQFMRGGPIS